MFIEESQFEDFYSGSRSSIMVSTMHKAKGKEFDNVFLMLENIRLDTPEAHRRLYVAMTRAKSFLSIHLYSDIFKEIAVTNLERKYNSIIYPPSDEAIIQTGKKDVYLDYFISRQMLVKQLQSGDPLTYQEGECFEKNGKSVLKFSKGFMESVKEIEGKGYCVETVSVGFIACWKKENGESEKDEYLVVLPKLQFRKGQ